MSNRPGLMDAGWVLATNLLVLAGVLFWGWPAGNVFVLFWVENVVLGVVTAVMIATAEGVDPAAPSTTPRGASTAFFIVHYGIFAVVHGVFATIIAVSIGLSIGLWTFGLPAIVIVLRYTVDLATGWFLGGGRRRVSPDQAFASPYPRLFVLHFATIIGFFAVVASFGRRSGGTFGPLGPALNWLRAQGFTVGNGALVVSVLLVIKTIADLAVLRARSKGTWLRFSYNGS